MFYLVIDLVKYRGIIEADPINMQMKQYRLEQFFWMKNLKELERLVSMYTRNME